MNAPLRRVAISVLVLFTLLIINVNVIQVVRADNLRNDKGNTRQLYAEYERERGAITVGGTSIASSEETDDALKYLRTYADGPTYAPVTGYYSLIYGSSGIEDTENDVLSGDDPRLTFRRLADVFTGRDPSGGNVELTLDPAVQKAAMDGLTGTGLTGAVVALDPATGAVLGLASAPTYDPNQLSSHDPKAIREYEKSLTEQQQVDHAISDRYSPGSVFKVLVSAAALSSGDYTPQTPVPAPDTYTLPGTRTPMENYNGESCNGGADQPLVDALTISCNTAFAELGVKLGEDKLRDMAEAFGITGDSGLEIPLPVVPSTLGSIDNDAQLAVSSIGQQDVQITPLQAAMIAATVANGGREMKPYLVESVQAPDLTTIDQTDPEELGRPISAEVAGQLDEMMTSVVTRGTGKRAAISGVKVAGKTGTAQTDPDAADNSWFVGYADANGKKIAVAVFFQGGGTGGDKSAPLAKSVMQAYLNGGG